MILGLKREDRKKYLGFDDAKFTLIGIPLLGLLVPFIFFKDFSKAWDLNVYLMKVIESSLHSLLYWIAVRFYVINLRKNHPHLSATRYRIIRELVFVLVIGVVLGTAITFFCHSVLNFPRTGTVIKGFIATYFSCFFILTIYEAMYLYHQNRKLLIAQEKQKREHIKSELQGLRNQVNPHFLFNSMNTLMNIIPEDQDLATSFLKKLSSVYRYILQSRDEYVIPLRQELDFIDAYVFLQKERFKDNLEVTFNIQDDLLDYHILPLSLQLLLENAIKHNVVSSKYPLHISIESADNYLVVENSIKLRKQKMPSTGVGLQNINLRYSYVSDRKVEIEETGQKFVVRLPLLKKHEILKK